MLYTSAHKPRPGTRIHPGNPYARGLTGAYLLDNDGVQQRDSSPMCHTLTLNSTHTTAGAPFGRVMAFTSGANSGGTITYDARNNFLSGFTVAAKFAYNFSGGNRSIVGRPANSTDTSPFLDWHLYVSSNQLAYGLNGTFVSTGIATLAAIDGATSFAAPFHYVVLTADGARVRVWVNGTSVYDAVQTALPLNTSSQPTTIGRYSPDTTQNFDGWMDHVCIWNYPMKPGMAAFLARNARVAWAPVRTVKRYAVAAAAAPAVNTNRAWFFAA